MSEKKPKPPPPLSLRLRYWPDNDPPFCDVWVIEGGPAGTQCLMHGAMTEHRALELADRLGLVVTKVETRPGMQTDRFEGDHAEVDAEMPGRDSPAGHERANRGPHAKTAQARGSAAGP